MAERALVLDANILIRGILGRRVHGLLGRYAADVAFYAPDTAFAEVEEHLAEVCTMAKVPLEQATETYEAMSDLIQELPAPIYGEHEAKARQRIEKRDPDDWPVVACALTMDCGIWTEDRDFFGIGIPTWTTDRVELFLNDAEKPKLEIKRNEDK